MWMLDSSADDAAPIRVLPGSVLTAGRNKGHPIYLDGVQSVSRLHARLESHPAIYDDSRPRLSVLDLSKLGGVTVNGRRVPRQLPQDLHDGDQIRFASHPRVLRARWAELRFCTSRIEARALARTGPVGMAAAVIGARLTRDLSATCSHLIVKDEPAVVTSKVGYSPRVTGAADKCAQFACALILGVEIVTETWLAELIHPSRHLLPLGADHRPRREDGSLICPETRFLRSSLRLFSSIAFVFFSTIQVVFRMITQSKPNAVLMSSFQNVIECAGGAVLQLLWRSDQRDVLDADDVLVELRALAQHAGGARLVLMHPGAVRMAPTAQIRASLERAGVVCNDESLIFASILDETITALRFVDASRLQANSAGVRTRHQQLTETCPPICRFMSVVTPPPSEGTLLPAPCNGSLDKTVSMALPQSCTVTRMSEPVAKVPPPPPTVMPAGIPSQTPTSLPKSESPVAESAMELQPVVTPLPPELDDTKPFRTIVAINNGAGLKVPAPNRLLKNFESVSSTAGNAVVIGFDIVLRPSSYSMALSDDTCAGTRNFKRFRKVGSSQGDGVLSNLAEAVARQESVGLSTEQGTVVGMDPEQIDDLQQAQERIERDEHSLDAMFEQAAQGGNTSRRRRR